MKIIVFGVGKVYQENKKYISDTDEIVAFVDNDDSLYGGQIDGITVHKPDDILNLSFDKIVMMSIYAHEMQQQLLKLGCSWEDMLHYKEYINRQWAGKMQILFPVRNRWNKRERCLIITTVLGYNGGTLAAVYAAMALGRKGYDVVVAAPDGDPVFVDEMYSRGICFVFYKNLSHGKIEELFWIRDFNYVIVNTLQMSCCAVEIAKVRNVILWLHEPLEMYRHVDFWRKEIEEGMHRDTVTVYAVSSIARKHFIWSYAAEPIQLLPYGIPDELCMRVIKQKLELTFAVVGPLKKIKGQDILLEALKRIDKEGEGQYTVLIIGKIPDSEYGRSIREKAGQYPNVQMTGECTREEMAQYYQEVDVLIIPSREETMSMVATEAMMLGKPCIISDASGMADYVDEYVNGLRFVSGDTEELGEKILWCIENRNELEKIGKQARKTYEKYFSMGIFGESLEAAIKQ